MQLFQIIPYSLLYIHMHVAIAYKGHLYIAETLHQITDTKGTPQLTQISP